MKRGKRLIFVAVGAAQKAVDFLLGYAAVETEDPSVHLLFPLRYQYNNQI